MTAWLAGGLALARLRGEAASPRRAAACAEAFLAEEHALPPLALLGDLAVLLHGEPFVLGAVPVPRAAARAVAAYEDQLLGRLASERLLERAADAVLRLPARARPRAVAHVAAALLARLGVPARAVAPAAARAFLRDPRPDPAAAGLVAEDLLALATAARGARVLLGEAEVAVLEHPALLESAAQRLAARQLLEAAAALDAESPARARRRRPRLGPRPVAAEGAWPAGGFAAVAPGSSLESLVPSELVYMDDEQAIDLFAVRWAEGDLLTYVRDESQSHSARRRVTFVLGPELAATRVRLPGERWQRVILILAALLCAARRLRDPATEIELAFLEPTPLGAELELCRLVHDGWRVTRVAEAPEGGVRVGPSATVAELVDAA